MATLEPRRLLPATQGWRSALLMATGALCFGYSLGVVPVYLHYDKLNTDCTHYSGEDGCLSAEFSDCAWLPGNSTSPGRCDFADYATVVCSRAHGDSDACDAIKDDSERPACTYDYVDDLCERAFGLSALQQGLYAAANVLGGFVGAPVAHGLSKRFGFRKAMLGLAALGAFPSVLASVARVTDTFWLMLVARVLMGVMGWGACYLCPLYPAHTQPEATASNISTGYQIFVDSGLLIAVVYGLAAEPREFEDATNIEARLHGLHGVQVVIAIVWSIVAVTSTESPFFTKEKGLGHIVPDAVDDATAAPAGAAMMEKDAVVQPEDDAAVVRPTSPAEPEASDGLAVGGSAGLADAAGEAPSEPTSAETPLTCGLKTRLYAVGFCVGSALQMTGVGPFVAFAPNIGAQTGLAPLEGTVVIIALFTLGAMMGPPIGRRINQRLGYVGGVVSTTIGCLILGVATMPGLAGGTTTPRFALSVIGILVFSIGFNALCGTFFFVWSQRVFPPEMVQPGSTFTNTLCSVEQMINTFIYPIAVVGISGGLAGDQRVGTAAMFFVYGGLGALFAVLVGLFMHPWRAPGSSSPVEHSKGDAVVDNTAGVAADDADGRTAV